MNKLERNRFEDQHIIGTIAQLMGKGEIYRIPSNLIDAPELIDDGYEQMAAHLVAMIESGELRIN